MGEAGILDLLSCPHANAKQEIQMTETVNLRTEVSETDTWSSFSFFAL